MSNALVSIVMGSDSDLPVMREAARVLEEFSVPFEMALVSAHRTPARLTEFSENAHRRGIEVIIAGAGGAAHLPGMVAALSPLAVIGVPVKSSNSLDGWDSLLSIAQMPGGVPVATVAVNGAKNAGLLAVQILSVKFPDLRQRLLAYKKEMGEAVLRKDEGLERGSGQPLGK